MPSSTARVTASNTSGLSPTSLACSSVMVPKPVSEPMNAAGLRPAPSISVCKRQTAGRRRPIGAGEDRAEFGPGDAERKAAPSDRRRRSKPRAGRRSGPCRISPATSSNTTSEPFNRATPDRLLRHQPRREHRALRIEGDAAVEAGRVPGDRFGGPAGPAAPRFAGIPIAAAITAGASSDSASIDPSIRGTSSKRTRPRPCTLLPPIVPANRSKSSVAG